MLVLYVGRRSVFFIDEGWVRKRISPLSLTRVIMYIIVVLYTPTFLHIKMYIKKCSCLSTQIIKFEFYKFIIKYLLAV